MTKKHKMRSIFTSLVILVFSLLIGLVYSVLPKPKTIEPTEKHEATVIFLHSLGSFAKNCQKNFQPISKEHPTVKFIFPQAPIRIVKQFKYLPMPSWYTIRGEFNPDGGWGDNMNPRKLEGNKRQLLGQIKKINKIIQSEVKSGIPAEKIVVMGSSQGASVALMVGLVSDYSLKNVTSLSGFLLNNWKEIEVSKKQNKQTFFSIHNRDYDFLVPSWAGKEAAKYIEEKGYQARFIEVWAGGHFYDEKEIKEILKNSLDTSN